MKTRFPFAALTALSLALVRPVAAQLPQYTISDQGPIYPDTGSPTTLVDVTRNGYALGYYQVLTHTPYPGQPPAPEDYTVFMVISKNGVTQTMNGLGLPPSNAKAVNDNGAALAHTQNYNPRFHDYLATAPYVFNAFGANNNFYGGEMDDTANALNNHNQAAVSTLGDLPSPSGYYGVAIWSDKQGGSGQISFGLPGDSNAEARGISENGLIAGASGRNFYYQYSFNPLSPQVVKHAVVWTPTTPNGLTGTSRALPPLQISDNSEAFAVNDLGEAAGTSGASNVYWNSTGAVQTIRLNAKSINNKSQILGSGLVWTAGGGVQNPTALIANPAGWSSLALYKLYNDGALVGTGQYNGATHIFLLTPVPVTLSGVVTLEGAVNLAQSVTFTLRPTNGATSTTVTQTLGADGSFALTNISPDNYTVLIRANYHLQKSVAASAITGSVTSIAVTLPAGDANNDNSVDSSDFGLLIGSFNTSDSIPGSGYDPSVDFNGDGFVDSTDFGLLIGNYGTSGDM